MELKTGLWKKQSKKGNSYYSGKIKIEDKEYWVRLFKNNKENEKQPDLNLILDKDIEVPKNPSQDALDDQIFKEFGEKVEIEESELAF
jgi:hypothetical protein